MNILLISPSSGTWKGIGKYKMFNGKTFRFSMLSLLSVAAITPKEHRITIVDEQFEDIPENEYFDLVGITAMTATAPRAYRLCSHFKEKSVPVVLGGFHPTLNPEEALNHADAIVTGPAYGAWPELIKDLERGTLKSSYRGNPETPIPEKLPRHLLKDSNYITSNATFATMGCKNSCHFCSISAFHRGSLYKRKIEDVVNEIKGFKEKFFMFVDDNLTQDREYIINLLKALAPLNKKWVTQATIDISEDEELLSHLKAAGCAGLFIGLETLSASSLQKQEKKVNAPFKYKEAIKKIHSYGIFIEAGIIFGFDADTIQVFRDTLNAVKKINLDAIQVSILTPLPGTQLYQEMQNRIIDRNWEHYDYKNPVFTPRQMTREELKSGSLWVRRKFYSPLNILMRFFRWLATPGGLFNLIFPLFLNIAYYGRLGRFKVKGYDPALKARQTNKLTVKTKLSSLISKSAYSYRRA